MMEIQNLFHKGGSLADRRYTEKERKSRSWEIAEKTTREEYTLEWSQSEVFLVHLALTVWCNDDDNNNNNNSNNTNQYGINAHDDDIDARYMTAVREQRM